MPAKVEISDQGADELIHGEQIDKIDSTRSMCGRSEGKKEAVGHPGLLGSPSVAADPLVHLGGHRSRDTRVLTRPR